MKLKYIIILATIILFISSKGGAELNEAFLYSTVLISHEVRPGEESSGTGFLVFKKINTNRGHVFLITNKHVLPQQGSSKKIKVRVNTKKNNIPQVENVEIPIYDTNSNLYDYVIMNPDKDTDVVAIHITQFITDQNIEGSWLPESICGTKDKLISENINVGDEIFLLGYPDAIYDPRNVFPILRQGTIATVPTEGYSFNDRLQKIYNLPNHIDGFLIDANVFPGSSGSLVILKPQSTTIGPQGQTVVSSAKKRPYLLGIVSMSIPIIDVNLRSVQRMGLGVVYSVETVIETIDYFYKK